MVYVFPAIFTMGRLLHACHRGGMGRFSIAGAAVWLSIVPVMSIASEIAQAVHLIPGSFDWVDLGLLTTGSIIGAILIKANGVAEYDK